jgi:protein-disulfide isomerase
MVVRGVGGNWDHRRMKRALPWMIIAAVFAAAVGGGAWMYRGAKRPVLPAPADSPPAPSTPGVVTLEEFGDYQCPPCGELHPILKTLKGEFGARLNVVFYHFPMTDIHNHALEAAHAANAAGLQGRFGEMHEQLYANQPAWSESPEFRPIVVNYARQLGLDVDRFTRDLDGPRVRELVTVDQQRGRARGVDGTPTVFLDGRPVDYDDLSAERLRLLIDRRLHASTTPAGK